jgi:hypothetical protein
VLVWVGPPEDDPVPADLDGTIESALADLSARTGRAWTQDDLPALTHGVLDRKVSGPQRPRGIEYALRFPQMSNRQAGFLTWNPEVIDPQMEAEAAGREPVPIAHSPRLFLSYRWSEDIDVNAIIDHYASTLWALGYDIVYDRDPRHLDKQLTAADVLLLLPGSTHYVPLLTDEFSQFVTRRPPEPLSPLDLEWQLARRLRERPEPLRWLGLWLSGDQLPAPITPDTVDDVRSGSLSLGPMFPECRFRLTVTARDGSTRHHQHLRRHELVEAIGAANAEADSVAVEVRDVTRRPAVWSAPIRKRRRSRAGS